MRSDSNCRNNRWHGEPLFQKGTIVTFYLIPGLGTDGRLFENLKLDGHRRKTLSWIEPNDGESITEYAQRLSSAISFTEPFAFIGVSFGGMMAVELAKILGPQKVFIISSVATKSQLPWYFRAIGRIRGYRLVSGSIIKRITPFLHLVLGKMTALELSLISDMLRRTSSRLLEWSIKEALTWKNEQVPPNVLQIHGSDDRLFPSRYVEAGLRVEGGTHLMILQKTEIIERLITSNLSSGMSLPLRTASAMWPSRYNVNQGAEYGEE